MHDDQSFRKHLNILIAHLRKRVEHNFPIFCANTKFYFYMP